MTNPKMNPAYSTAEPSAARPTRGGAQRFHASRGELVDIGGRRLRAVRSGLEHPGPLIVLEHGAFGCAADWASVQARLAAGGRRNLAYDRAGLGFSDAGPGPRDGHAIVADLDALLARTGETGPLLLVGHSMGGLMVRLFALTHPQRVSGLVLVDPVTPEAMDLKAVPRFVDMYGQAMRWVGIGARAGLMHPVSHLTGNLIGLVGEAAVEKRRIYASASHAQAAADEVLQWPRTAELARTSPLPASLPIAVLTAGEQSRAPRLKAAQVMAATAADRSYVEHVPGAGHASLLGEKFADRIVAAVERVLGES